MNKFIIIFIFCCTYGFTVASQGALMCCPQKDLDECHKAGGQIEKACNNCVCPEGFRMYNGICCDGGKDTKGNATAECCKASGGVLLTNIGPELKTKCCDCSASMGQNIPECHGI